MIYFAAISLSVFFAWLLGRVKGMFQLPCFLAAVLIPSLVWGIRSTDMGNDVNLYALPIWNFSQELTLFDYGSYYGSHIESGYLLLNYILTRFFVDIHWMLFILAFCACFAVLFSLFRSEFKNVAWLGYAYYLLIFFPRTINIVRQGFANALLVAAAVALFQRKWKTFCVLVLLGSSFHNSAMVAISFPIIFFIFKKKNSSFRQIALSIVVLVCTLFAQSFFSHLLFFNDKYEIYLNGSFKPHFTIFSLINIPFIAIFFLYYKSFRAKFTFFSEELFCLISGVILGQLSWIVAVYMARVSQPYNLFIIFAPMMFVLWIKQRYNKETVCLAKILSVSYAILYFILVFVINGESGVYPYQSEIADHLLQNIL